MRLNRNLRTIVVVLVLVAAIGAGLWYFLVRPGGTAAASALAASGTVEATEISIAPQTSGRVVSVLVQEGARVKAGDLLLQLDDSDLQTQRQKVAAAGQAAVAAAHLQVVLAQNALDTLRQTAPLTRVQDILALANARKALDDATRLRSYNQKGNRATNETIDATQARLVLADQAVDQANKAFRAVANRDQSDPERAAAFAALDTARQERDAIAQNLNWYQGAPSDIDQAILDAKVQVTTEQVTQAQLELKKWQDGPDPAALSQAQAALDNAIATQALAEAQSQSDLRAIDSQLDKLRLRASVDGTILSRAVEPGEVIVAGSTALVLGQLDLLTLTVYVPEDRVGEVALGQIATVSVDSFPGETFKAAVSFISDQAEFTPRNVQTVEGRKTTVFAVKLRLDDPSGKLKPGMPADVTFGR